MLRSSSDSGLHLGEVRDYEGPDIILVALKNERNEDIEIKARLVVPLAAEKGGVHFLPKKSDRVVLLCADHQWFVVGSLYTKEMDYDGASKEEPEAAAEVAPLRRIRTEDGFQLIWDDSEGKTKFVASSPNGKNYVALSPESDTPVRIAVGSGTCTLKAKDTILVQGDEVLMTAKQGVTLGKKSVTIFGNDQAIVGSTKTAVYGAPTIGGQAPTPAQVGEASFAAAALDGSEQSGSNDESTAAGDKPKGVVGKVGQALGKAGEAIGDVAEDVWDSLTQPSMAGNRTVAGKMATTLAKMTAQAVVNVVVAEGLSALFSGNNKIKTTVPPGCNATKVQVVDENGNVVSESDVTCDENGNVEGDVDVPASDGEVTVQVVDENGTVVGSSSPMPVDDTKPGTPSPSTELGDPLQPTPSQAIADEQSMAQTGGLDRETLDAAEDAMRGDLSSAQRMVEGELAGAVAVPVGAAGALAAEPGRRVDEAERAADSAQRDAENRLKEDSGVADAERARDQARQRESAVKNDVSSAQRAVEDPYGVRGEAASAEAEAQSARRDGERAAADFTDPAVPDPEASLRESRAAVSERQMRETRAAGDARRAAEDVQRDVDPTDDVSAQARRSDPRGEVSRSAAERKRQGERIDEELTDSLKDELDNE